ncbi:MAG: heme-binding domain-containing protein [Candidatus Sulfotelmatobacter sp.]
MVVKLTVRTLKSMVALAALAVMVGQVRSEPRAVIEPRNQGLPLLQNSAGKRVLLRACGNCHSNHTDWPWYAHVAPVSWWITRDVREGRKKMNFSLWTTYSERQKRDRLDSICGLISTGRMPPWLYTVIHPEAKLTETDKKAVCTWAKEQTVAPK